jgi:hypothetical protein
MLHGVTMGCPKDKTKRKPKPGDYRCKKCGAVSEKKKAICEPKKVKK